MVPVGFLVFMLSMGVALLRRRSRVKGVPEVSAAGTEMSAVCGVYSDLT